jgi:hypothetical protein
MKRELTAIGTSYPELAAEVAGNRREIGQSLFHLSDLSGFFVSVCEYTTYDRTGPRKPDRGIGTAAGIAPVGLGARLGRPWANERRRGVPDDVSVAPGRRSWAFGGQPTGGAAPFNATRRSNDEG